MFFEIPIERIQSHATYWYRWQAPWINGYPGESVPSVPPLDEFEQFDATRYRELADVPSAHVAYLEQRSADGRRALMFVHIPHVLVAGPIETGGLRTIDWADAPTSAGG